MSICCDECWRDLSPLALGQHLPGREGLMVRPIVLALIWDPDYSNKHGWVLRHVLADNRIALCFECLEKKIPSKQMPLLAHVYKTLDCEMQKELIDQDMNKLLEKGIMPNSDSQTTAHKNFYNLLDQINPRECLLCESRISVEQKLPAFRAIAFNRVKSSHGLKFAPWGATYQLTNHALAHTSFLLCFECLRQNFPKLFTNLSLNIMGKPKINHPDAKNEFFITSEVAEHLTADKLIEVIDMGAEIKDPPIR